MTFVIYRFCFVIILLSNLSCSDSSEKFDNSNELSKEQKMEYSQNSMKAVVKKEQEQIKNYIKRKGGTFKSTGTGVHYFVINKNPIQEQIKTGDKIEIKYILTLLNGDTIHSQIKNAEKVLVDYQNKESGLHEVLKLMKKGEKAIIIIPSHRAHGFTGNDKDIPPLSTLVYQLEILNTP